MVSSLESLRCQQSRVFPSFITCMTTAELPFSGSFKRVSQGLPSPSKWLLMGPIQMVMVAISAFLGAVLSQAKNHTRLASIRQDRKARRSGENV